MFPCASPTMNDVVTLPKFSIIPQSITRYKPGHIYGKKTQTTGSHPSP